MTQQMEAPLLTDEQVTAAQEYLDIHNRRVKAECRSCTTEPRLNLGFAEQFAAGQFMTAIGFELADYPEPEEEKKPQEQPKGITRLSVEDRILSQAVQIVDGEVDLFCPNNVPSPYNTSYYACGNVDPVEILELCPNCPIALALTRDSEDDGVQLTLRDYIKLGAVRDYSGVSDEHGVEVAATLDGRECDEPEETFWKKRPKCRAVLNEKIIPVPIGNGENPTPWGVR